VYEIYHQWQADLVDLGKLASYNKGFKYLLTCIDVLSRYAWIVPLKDKTGKTSKDAFQVIFKSGRRPIRLQTDKGAEFTNRVFQKFLKEHDVHFFTTHNEETKASIVERFNRTLKTEMWKYFTHRETLTYVVVLSEMVASYNHTVHRTIGIPSAEVTWANQTTVSKRLCGRKGPKTSCKFSSGDRVRLSKARCTFKKGYLPNWTEELFTVVKCIETRPLVYLVKDDHGEILEGTLYIEELQKVIKTDDMYNIETILKKRKKGRRVQYLVKWLGYPESFNSWIFKHSDTQCIVLGDLWREDSTFGGRIFVSGTHPVHDYRSQHLQLDGRIGEQYLLDGLAEQLSGIPVT
jgi:hypothetical protein